MWAFTIFVIFVAFTANIEHLFSMHIVLLIISVFSIYNKRIMLYFIGIYSAGIIPAIAMSQIPKNRVFVSMMGIGVVLVLAYIKSSYDLMLFKEVHQMSASNEMLLNNAFEGFVLQEVLYDEHKKPYDYRFVTVNSAFADMIGIKKEDIIGQNLTQLLPGMNKQWLNLYSEVVEANKPVQMQQYSHLLNKHVYVSAYPVDKDTFAILFSDVTDKVEQQYKVEQAILGAKKADRLKDQFLRDINHRLRTPLNGMMGMLQLIDLDQVG